MKKNYFLVSALVIAVGFLSFQNSGNEQIEKFVKFDHKDSGGKNGAYAGAPNDANCTSCHTGATQSGAAVNNITMLQGTTPVTSYTPGTAYTVSLTMSPNPTKKGFQAVAMNSSHTIVGTATGSTVGGTQIKTTNRPTHKSTSNTSSNLAWIWNWTAPSTDQGDITIYVASMSANNNGNDGSGDVVYLSTHVFPVAAAGISEQVQNKNNFSAGYAADQNAVVMDFSSLIEGKMYFNLVDMSGKSVFTYKMGQSQIGENHEKIVLPADLKDGIYIVNMFVNNTVMEQKIMVQK